MLGGWSVSDDQSLKEECIQKALVNIPGAQNGGDGQSQVSGSTCLTQVVNGLNIKCTLTLSGEQWECKYYKSFFGTRETQLQGCALVKNSGDQENPTAFNEDGFDDDDLIDAMYG
ncbi:unnamed protein product [Adineta steineri]|uniref:Uncharacterized protein n=1 Tax=Adineta steineri TaxID=433720 RepID=A0A813TQ82_9BILA|nr:unnamed protein product [Adineta steineri]